MSKKAYTIKDFYNHFISSYDKYEYIDYKLYRSIIIDMFKLIQKELIINSNEIKLPFTLGDLYICKYKPKNYNKNSLSVDYFASKQAGVRVYHLNEHSDGYKCRLFWSRCESKTKFIQKYSINLIRANKRLLASVIKNKITDFQEL